MKQLKSRLFSLFMVMLFAMIGLPAMATSTTYYSKATVKSTGNGTVYVATSDKDDASKYATEVSANNSSTTQDDEQTYYLFATPADGYKLEGWYTNEECTEGKVNGNTVSVKASSKEQSSPTVGTWYAKFVEATEFYSSTMTVSCIGEGGSVAVSTVSGNEDFGAEKSASNLNDVEAAHTYYLQAKVSDADNYRFLGWYSDEACQTQISKNANYTYKVNAESTDQVAPSQFHAYAKFEAIPYYYSKVTATALGNGKVNVATSNRAGNYNATSEASQKIADNAEHTYYLKAQTETDIQFDGWFATEDCEGEPLSKNLNYTVKVSECSNALETQTLKNYYAKFTDLPVLRCETARLYFNVGDEAAANDGVVCKNTTITGYTSSNTAVATVAADGKVTPVATGSTIITISAEGVDDVTYVATVLDYSEAGKTQIGNSDFEDWSSVTNNNHAPKNWNSFETNEGTWATTARAQQIAMKEDHRPGSNGLFCVDIYSRSVIGVVAQGNLTLGCINAGSTSAANAANHNFSKITDPNKSETIDRIPTAVKVWVKFVPAENNANYPYARVAATIHDAHNYITQGDAKNDTEANKAYAVAQAEKNFEACEWTELVLPFELTKNAVVDGQLYIIFNASTNASPGKGQAGDHLYVDDIELVYDTDYDKVPVTVSDSKYATFVAPFDVKMPAAITASTVETVGKEYDTMLDLTAVENNLVPANTPVILSSKDAQDRVAYGVAKPAEAVEGLLTGVYEETEAPVGSYVLQNIDGVVGFYQVAADQQPTVKANHAYLTAASEAKVFVFTTDDATAIQSIQAEAEQGAAIYNLAGQRVQKAVKGINIINGKKILK